MATIEVVRAPDRFATRCLLDIGVLSARIQASPDGVIGVTTDPGGMEAEDDVLARDTGLDQRLGDGTRGPIVLDPDLAAPDVEVWTTQPCTRRGPSRPMCMTS